MSQTQDPAADLSARERYKLELIAKKGERKHVLWELASDGRDFCGVEFTAQEYGLEDEPLEVQVDRFIEDMRANEHEYFQGTDLHVLERNHGDVADAVGADAHYQTLPDVPHGWINQGEHPDSGIVAQCRAWYSNGEYDVMVWSGVREKATYGEPGEFDKYAVEVHGPGDHNDVEGWFFKKEEAAIAMAIGVMKSYVGE